MIQLQQRNRTKKLFKHQLNSRLFLEPEDLYNRRLTSLPTLPVSSHLQFLKTATPAVWLSSADVFMTALFSTLKLSQG